MPKMQPSTTSSNGTSRSKRVCGYLCPGGSSQPARPELLEFVECFSKVCKEFSLIFCIHADILLKLVILNQYQISGEHHQCFTFIFILIRTFPISLRPLDCVQKSKVKIVECGREWGPRAIISRCGGVADCIYYSMERRQVIRRMHEVRNGASRTREKDDIFQQGSKNYKVKSLTIVPEHEHHSKQQFLDH